MKFIFFLLTVVSGFTIPNTRIVVLPGYGCCKDDYQDIVNSCAVHNVDVDIVPIERHDWIQPMKSVFKKKFWDYKLTPEDSFDWYLEKAKHTIIESVKKNDDYSIVLCGHSAGGWLGRALLQNGTFYGTNKKAYQYVYGVVTLGTPNVIEDNHKLDTTHGCLHYVNKNFPGSFLKKQGIKYISLGSYAKKASKTDAYKFYNENSIVYKSYSTILGKNSGEHIYGDGVVPLDSMHIQDAIQLTFHDVFHYKQKDKKWYGDPYVVNAWLGYL